MLHKNIGWGKRFQCFDCLHFNMYGIHCIGYDVLWSDTILIEKNIFGRSCKALWQCATIWFNYQMGPNHDYYLFINFLLVQYFLFCPHFGNLLSSTQYLRYKIIYNTLHLYNIPIAPHTEVQKAIKHFYKRSQPPRGNFFRNFVSFIFQSTKPLKQHRLIWHLRYKINL